MKVVIAASSSLQEEIQKWVYLLDSKVFYCFKLS
jgi:hypothetical protein